MLSEKAQSALIDIVDAIASAQAFTAGMSLDDFKSSRLHFFATTRALEIVSEASRRLPASIREKHPHLPWKKIMGAGNIYRHEYDNVQETMIWLAVQNDLPGLLSVAGSEIEAAAAGDPECQS